MRTINCILSYFLANNMDLYWKFKVKNGTVIILEGIKILCVLKNSFDGENMKKLELLNLLKTMSS